MAKHDFFLFVISELSKWSMNLEVHFKVSYVLYKCFPASVADPAPKLCYFGAYMGFITSKELFSLITLKPEVKA